MPKYKYAPEKGYNIFPLKDGVSNIIFRVQSIEELGTGSPHIQKEMPGH